MGDTQNLDADSTNPYPPKEMQNDKDHRPFGGLEFQVSEVVERLEAGVNGQETCDQNRKRESHKISANSFVPEPTALSDILKNLEELVINSDPSGDNCETPFLPSDTAARAAILAHSLSALFGKLERTHAARLGAHIASETTLWLSHMFRLSDYHAYYHQEQLDGLVRVVRMLLHHRYPRYLEDGALAFSNRLPCIYSSVASPLGVVQHLCRQLGLPLACVRPVPVHANGCGMDLESLERLCDEDTTAGRSPILVLAEAGAPPLGAGENLRAISTICAARRLHLHVRGHALALPATLPNDQSMNVADSLTLTPGPWFGIAGLPIVTFFRIPETVSANESKTASTNSVSREGALAALGGLSGGGARLPALPAWAALRAAGGRALGARLVAAATSARALYHRLLHTKGVRIQSGFPGGDEQHNMDVVDVVSNASCCVAWQFSMEDCERPPPYYDKLNSWLGQVLQREADMINIEICETETHGVVLRYCPLEGAILQEDRIEEFSDVLQTQLLVLHATVSLREPFQTKVEEHPLLRLINVPGWAGLGGVRYVPPNWENATEEEVNTLNRQLVETLRTTDNAFSCGENEEGLSCVRFGMVTEDTDVEELLELVITAGKEVEETSKALTNMSEVLKKGIQEARLELERSSAERLWQEGLLRRVPVVGRVVGWWAPPPPAPSGRRLHLHCGTLQPTDDVYKAIQKKEIENTPAPSHSPTPYSK